MTTTANLEERPLWLDSWEYSQAHPDLADYQIQILSVYRTCTARHHDRGRGTVVYLKDAHAHIFERNGGCEWCKEALDIAIDHLQRSTKKIVW